jgi:branched-chain amino acid transport system substrate-binding protein
MAPAAVRAGGAKTIRLKRRRLLMQKKVEGKHGGVSRLRVLLALFAALLVIGVAVGCGDEESSGSSAGGGASAGSSTTDKEAAKSGDQTVSAGVDDYAEYVGAKSSGAADPSKSPITIGWVNQQGGAGDIGPASTKGADLAVKYLNEKLGGIDGHPVKLFKCFTSTSEEQGQACGQKMVNHRDVKIIAMGAVSVGDQSLVATVDGQKPMITSVAVGPSDPKNTNGYALFGDSIRVSGPLAAYASKVLKAKSISVVHPEHPSLNESSKGVVAAAKKLGMDAQSVSWSPNATDLVGPLTAAGAQTADVIITNPDPKGCVNLYKALQSLKIDTPVVSNPLCLNELVAKALGDLPQWTYGIATTLASDMADPTAQAYAKVTKEYGAPVEYSRDPWIPASFHEMLTIFQWMNKVGADNITEQTLSEQAKAFKGPQAWGAPTIQCGKYPEAPGICNDQEKFYKYEGKGRFAPAGGWQQAP